MVDDTKHEPSEYASLTIEDHIRSKDLWAGTTERIATPMLIFERVRARVLGAKFDTVQLSPALFKCVDEPIVNALDQAQRSASAEGARTTTEMRIGFDAATGFITIANNGAGIPIEKRETTRGMFVPQFVFGVVFTGSNMTAGESSTLGGTNGIGVKITNIHSNMFRVSTYDRERNKSFVQTWTNGMRECSPPAITDGIPEGASGTEVAFQLNYERFKTTPSEIEPVIFTRIIWAAFYAAYMLPRLTIFWNGKKLAYTREQYAMAIFAARMSNKMDATTVARNIKIDSITSASDETSAVIIASPDVKRYAMSVINGIVVPTGNHIDSIFDVLRTATKENLAKSLRASDVSTIPGVRTIVNRLAIIVLWRATGVHWSGQSKDHAQFKTVDLRAALTPSEIFVKSISDTLAGAIVARLDSARGTAPSDAPGTGKKRVAVDKYTPAHFAGTRKSSLCRLFLAEGDSAKSQVETGLSRSLGFDYYGVLSLRGVIPNVRKLSVKQADATGEVKHKRSQKLIDNKFMTTLVQVLGIDFSRKYADPRERATLRYGGVIGCVDQDLDGVGNIFSLLLNLFHLFWPALLEAGYIQRLATPIIRAFPIKAKGSGRSKKGLSASPKQVNVIEFYSDEEYREWASQAALDQFKIRYYKGLGKHNPQEMKQIMANIKTQIITYQNDELAREMFEVYLGRVPELRRIQLSKPPPEADPDLDQELQETRLMPSSYHLLREAHTYQLDNLHRKINDVIGGTNQVSCKIIDGCFKIFARSHDERMVVDIAGTITTLENYHHGDASLQDAIIRRGFIAPGGNQLPLLLPIGNFGKRLKGGADASPARYISAEFNFQINSVLYQAEDYPLLDFHVDEGKRGEPKFFIPIIPTAIIEHIEVPAHGWNIRVWAREVMDVIANLRMMIATNGAIYPAKMRPCCYPKSQVAPLPERAPWNEACERVVCDCTAAQSTVGEEYLWHGYIIERAFGKQPETWSVGTYYWISEDTITIDELPLCVWTVPYMQSLTEIADREDSFIKKFKFASGDMTVDIQITFKTESDAFSALGIEPAAPGTRSPASLSDPIIRALYLRDRMADNLNFMMPDESVRTFATYEDVLVFWFPIRRDYYERRIARQCELILMWIMFYENVIRYIQAKRANAIKSIVEMTVEEAEHALAAANFVPLDSAALDSPELKFEVHIVERIMHSPKASFAYILNLRERDVTTDGCARYDTLLAKERASLASLRESAAIGPGAPFVGARIWLAELDLLAARINEGRATEWQFGDFGRFKFT